MSSYNRSATKRAFKLLQWNIKGLVNNKEELKLLIKEYQPSVIAIQETKLKPNNIFNMNAYQTYRKDYINPEINGNATMGIALLTHKSIYTEPIPLTTNLQVNAIKIKPSNLNYTITIANIYIHPNDTPSKNEIMNLINQLPHPFILCGDFNAHNRIWGDSNNCQKGKTVEDILNSSPGISLMNNPRKKTFFSFAHKTYSAIDLTLVSTSISSSIEWNTHPELCTSDHYPIISQIQSTKEFNAEKKTIWLYNKADWQKYHEEINFHKDLNRKLENNENIDILIETVNKNILEAAQKAIPTLKTHKYNPIPWWNDKIQIQINERKRAYLKHLKYKTIDNLIDFKKKRAIVKLTIKKYKDLSWNTFLDQMNGPVNSSQMWNHMKKLKGNRKYEPINGIENSNGIIETDQNKLTELIANHFQKVSSNENFSLEFMTYKNQTEQIHLEEIEEESVSKYNIPIKYQEMTEAIKQTKSTAVGPDNISYQMIKKLPEDAIKGILAIYNYIWTTRRYPSIWKIADVIPIAKANKPKNKSTSYRPISLICCMSKIMERIINKRLNWILESKNLYAEHQNGGRNNRNTMDSIIQLEDTVLNGFVENKHTIATFIDVEKAFDQTWTYKALSKLNQWEIKGNLYQYLKNFLKDNKIIVNNKGIKSSLKQLENGIRQGSSLSATIFNCILSEIQDVIPMNVQYSIYIDDINIFTSNRDIQLATQTMQNAISRVANWAYQTGFQLSKEKTVSMHFHRTRQNNNIQLQLNNENIKVMTEFKWLGMIIDSKWTWNAHINNLKKKVTKALNLMKMIAHSSWGLKRETLDKIFKVYIQPIIEYGAIAYDSAKPNLKCKLNPVLNQAIRIITGAFRTSPVSSILAEAGKMPLDYRRKILISNYILKKAKVKNHPLKDAVKDHSSTINKEFGAKPKTIIKRAIDYKLLNEKAKYIFELTIKPPWETVNIKTEALDINKKEAIPAHIVRSMYNQHRRNNEEYQAVFTDGSKTNESTGCCFVINNEISTYKLDKNCSNYTAEMAAIYYFIRYLQMMSDKTQFKKIMIYTDAKSVIQAIMKPNPRNEVINKIQTEIIKLEKIEKIEIILVWIPSHAGIPGNEKADQEAKRSNQLVTCQNLIACEDILHKNKKEVTNLWQLLWTHTNQTNKLRKIKETIDNWNTSNRKTRQEEIKLTRLRIGHSRMTHSYIINKTDPPICEKCRSNTQLTIDHIMAICPALQHLRDKHNLKQTTQENIKDDEAAVQNTMNYIKEANIYQLL